MRFADIIGQGAVKARLIQSVREGRIPHAQLFCGPEGVGKLQLAVAYTQYINCQHPLENDSCGQCPSCLQYQRLQHPDLHFSFPCIKPEKAKTVVSDDYMKEFTQMILDHGYFGEDEWYTSAWDSNKQGLITEAESGAILRKLSLKAYGGGYKTMIIWLPERMHEACANKILKILEEPPEGTLFLLVSNQPDRLLTTIVSRTQRIQIPRLGEAEIAQALRRSDDSLSYEQSSALAHAAAGSYLHALRLARGADQEREHFARFQQIMRQAWLVGHKKDYQALQTLREWSSDMGSATVGRERQKDFLAYMQHMVRENYISNLHQDQLNYMTDEEARFAVRFAPFINSANVEPLMDEIAKAQRHIEQNVNARMVFFDLALKLIVLLK